MHVFIPRLDNLLSWTCCLPASPSHQPWANAFTSMKKVVFLSLSFYLNENLAGLQRIHYTSHNHYTDNLLFTEKHLNWLFVEKQYITGFIHRNGLGHHPSVPPEYFLGGYKLPLKDEKHISWQKKTKCTKAHIGFKFNFILSSVQ